MKNLHIRQLKAYQAIISTGSATAAAELLSVSQPAISRALAALETDLGFQLFDRRGRHLVHSDKGRRFYRMIEPTLSGLDALPEIIDDVRSERGSPLRIASIGPLLHSKYLPFALHEFQNLFPDLRLEVRYLDRFEIEHWVANLNADIALTMLPVDHPSLKHRELVTVNAVAVLPVGHPLASKPELGPTDFRGERVIMPERKARLRQLADRAMLDSKQPLPIAIETSSEVTTCHLIAAGLGVGISDPFSVTGISEDRIVVRPWKPAIRISYAAAWSKFRALSERSEQFIDILCQTDNRLTTCRAASEDLLHTE